MSKIGTAMLRNKFNSMVMIKSGIFSHLHPPYSTTKLLGPQLCLFHLLRMALADSQWTDDEVGESIGPV